jgi:hypothetical protein
MGDAGPLAVEHIAITEHLPQLVDSLASERVEQGEVAARRRRVEHGVAGEQPQLGLVVEQQAAVAAVDLLLDHEVQTGDLGEGAIVLRSTAARVAEVKRPRILGQRHGHVLGSRRVSLVATKP